MFALHEGLKLAKEFASPLVPFRALAAPFPAPIQSRVKWTASNVK